jgi:hypothetical protein
MIDQYLTHNRYPHYRPSTPKEKNTADVYGMQAIPINCICRCQRCGGDAKKEMADVTGVTIFGATALF